MADDAKSLLLEHIFGADRKRARKALAIYQEDYGNLPRTFVDQTEDGKALLITEHGETFGATNPRLKEGQWIGGEPEGMRRKPLPKGVQGPQREITPEEWRRTHPTKVGLPGPGLPRMLDIAGEQARSVAGLAAGLAGGGVGLAATAPVRTALTSPVVGQIGRAGLDALVGAGAGVAQTAVGGGDPLEGAGMGMAFEGGLSGAGRLVRGVARTVTPRLMATPAGKAVARLRRGVETPREPLPDVPTTQAGPELPKLPTETQAASAAQEAAQERAKESAVRILGAPEALGKDKGKLREVWEERFQKPYAEAVSAADASPAAGEIAEGGEAILGSLDDSLTSVRWTDTERSAITQARENVEAAIEEGFTHKKANEIRQQLDELARMTKSAPGAGRTPRDVALADAAARAREIVSEGPYAEANAIYAKGMEWQKEARVRLGLAAKPRIGSLTDVEKSAGVLSSEGTKGRMGGMAERYPELAEEIGAPEAVRTERVGAYREQQKAHAVEAERAARVEADVAEQKAARDVSEEARQEAVKTELADIEEAQKLLAFKGGTRMGLSVPAAIGAMTYGLGAGPSTGRLAAALGGGSYLASLGARNVQPLVGRVAIPAAERLGAMTRPSLPISPFLMQMDLAEQARLLDERRRQYLAEQAILREQGGQ